MKNLLFDLDGTLTDPYLGITNCIKHALEELGVDNKEDLGWCIGPPLQESFAKLLVKTNHLPEKAISLYRERFADVGMFENKVYEGIPEPLSALKENGYRLFVATSKPHIYAKQIIDHFHLNFFEKVYGSELDGVRADKGDLIKFILSEEGLDFENTIMIGDRKHDLIGAKKNGLKSIAVTWGYGSREELEAEGPSRIVESPGDLAEAILVIS